MNTYDIRFVDDNGRIKSVKFASTLSGDNITAEIVRNRTVTVTDHKTRITHVIPSSRIVSVEKL
jgi:hypothetical protein